MKESPRALIVRVASQYLADNQSKLENIESPSNREINTAIDYVLHFSGMYRSIPALKKYKNNLTMRKLGELYRDIKSAYSERVENE